MANHKSALKRIKQSVKRTERNRAEKTKIKTAEKKYQQALETGENVEESLKQVISVLARAAGKGIIPRKRADRKASRLTRKRNATLAS